MTFVVIVDAAGVDPFQLRRFWEVLLSASSEKQGMSTMSIQRWFMVVAGAGTLLGFPASSQDVRGAKDGGVGWGVCVGVSSLPYMFGGGGTYS